MVKSKMALKLSVVVFAICFILESLTSVTADIEPDLAQQLIAHVESLESHIRQQDVKLKDLEAQVKKQEEEIQILKLNTKTNSVPPSDIRKDGKHITSGTSQHNGIAKSKSRPLLRATRATHQNVAFSAFLDHEATHVAIDNIVTFNRPIINDGNGYSSSTGIFTCPVSGVYLFTYVVNTKSSVGQLVVKLVVDGVNVSDGTSDPMHHNQEIQGGNTVIVRVNQGQAVWLAAYNTGNTLVDGRPDHRFSTISGALLYT